MSGGAARRAGNAGKAAGKDAGQAVGTGEHPCGWIQEFGASTAQSSKVPVGTHVLYDGARYEVVCDVGAHEVCIKGPHDSFLVVPFLHVRPLAVSVDPDAYMTGLYPRNETVQVDVGELGEPAAAHVQSVFSEEAKYCDGVQRNSAPRKWFARVIYLDGRKDVHNVVPLEAVFQAEFRTGMHVALADGTRVIITKVLKDTYWVRLADGTDIKVPFDQVHALPTAR